MPYVAITCVIAVIYVQDYKVLVGNILAQMLIATIFYMRHLTPVNFSGWNFVVHCMWPQCIMCGGFFILSHHYLGAIQTLKDVNTQLDATSKAKSDFLSIIGHEVCAFLPNMVI